MTTAQFLNSFKQLQALDLRAGRLFGNADHVRKQGTDDLTYALMLAGKVLLAGISIAFVELMVGIIFALGNSTFAGIASIGSALSIMLIGWTLYSDLKFGAAFVIGISTVSFGALAAGIHGVDWHVTLEVTAPGLASGLGLLLGLDLLETLVRLITQSFKPAPKPKREPREGSLQWLIDHHYVSAGEKARLMTAMVVIALVETVWIVSAVALLLMYLSSHNMVWLVYVAISGVLIVGGGMRIFVNQLDRLQRAATARRILDLGQ